MALCQTDDSEQGSEASVIPGRGREQVNKLVVTGLLQDCAVLTRVSNLAWPAWVHRSNAGVMSPSGMTPCRGGHTHLRAFRAPEVCRKSGGRVLSSKRWSSRKERNPPGC